MPSSKMIRSALTALGFAAAVSAKTCDPLTATCPAAPGLATPSYFIDFTQQTDLPANWTLATAETVTYGCNGAEFTFAKRYDAPYIWTDFYFLFGTVEIVAQPAPGQGIISSLVLISDDLDEIDWEFSGTNFGSSPGLIQTNYFGKGITGSYDRGTQVPTTFGPQLAFHTYTLDWTPTQLTWSIDGTAVRVLNNSGATSGPHQFPQTPMQLHLGLWDAGDAATAPGTVAWAGGYTNLSAAPFTAFVKSVSITNANPCAAYRYADASGAASSILCGNTTALDNAGGADAPQQVNGNQAPGAANGTATCGYVRTHTSSLPAATGAAGGNATMSYAVPVSPTATTAAGSATSSTYMGAGSRLRPLAGLSGVLRFLL